MIFRQLFDAESSTYTYLLACPETREAIVIDPVYEQHGRDLALIRELGVDLRYAIDTHVHADHVTGAWLLHKALGACNVVSANSRATGAQRQVDDGDVLTVGRCALHVMATPGHTNGCLTLVTRDRDMAFTGDSLMIRSAGRTDFQAGDVHQLWRSIREKIFTLPDDCMIYPGHDYLGRTVSTVAEEKQFNPRIGGDAREEDFVGYMENLGLPHPRHMKIAVPANMNCGKPNDGKLPEQASWGPVTLTFDGVPEVPPEWVASNLDKLFVLDVRSLEEAAREPGGIGTAPVIPLNELRERLNEVPQDRPVVTLCQSGKRSALAAKILLQSGYEQVANISGGIIQWSRLGLPAQGN